MTSFLPRCRRTIQPRQMIESVITVQPSSETAAGPIFSNYQTDYFLLQVEIRILQFDRIFPLEQKNGGFFLSLSCGSFCFLFAWTLISRDADFTSHKQIAHHKIKKLCLYMANAEIMKIKVTAYTNFDKIPMCHEGYQLYTSLCGKNCFQKYFKNLVRFFEMRSHIREEVRKWQVLKMNLRKSI